MSLGANPIVTLSCFGHPHYQNVYQVPTGMTLVITDFHIGSNTNGYIRVGASSSLGNADNILRHYLYNGSPTHMSFSSGITVAEGLYVQCTGGNDGSFAAGYSDPLLMRRLYNIGYDLHMMYQYSISKPKLSIWILGIPLR